MVYSPKGHTQKTSCWKDMQPKDNARIWSKMIKIKICPNNPVYNRNTTEMLQISVLQKNWCCHAAMACVCRPMYRSRRVTSIVYHFVFAKQDCCIWYKKRSFNFKVVGWTKAPPFTSTSLSTAWHLSSTTFRTCCSKLSGWNHPKDAAGHHQCQYRAACTWTLGRAQDETCEEQEGVARNTRRVTNSVLRRWDFWDLHRNAGRFPLFESIRTLLIFWFWKWPC